MTAEAEHDWDLFLSYASEDRETVARPLAVLLKRLELDVWFDQTELTLGDSLQKKIDEGLAHSRFGVVILSPNFFEKHYPERELTGLAQREMDGEKVILPVWHDVDDADVRNYSPPLANRFAVAWSDGIDAVATEILRVVRPDILEKLNRLNLDPLPELESGNELLSVMNGSHESMFYNDELDGQAEANLIGGFLQELQDWGDILSQIGVGGRVEAETRLRARLEELAERDWRVFGRKVAGTIELGGEPTRWTTSVIAVIRGNPESVFRVGKSIRVVRSSDTSTT